MNLSSTATESTRRRPSDMVCSELPGGCRRWLGPSVPICQPSWAEAGPDTGSRFERGRLYVVHCSLGPQLLGTSSRVAESRETFATTGVTLRPRCLFGAHPGGPGEIDKLSLPLVFSEPEGHDDDLLGKKLFPCFPASCKSLVAETFLGIRDHRSDGCTSGKGAPARPYARATLAPPR